MGAGLLAGERVRRAATGEDGVVLSAGDGVLVQVAFSSGTVWIHREELEKLPEGPAERLAAAELGQLEPYGLRLQSLYLRHAYRYDPLTGLSSARIEPQLHQVFVAHRVTQKLQPRMILADEVGLGKTIEAGLIIKELRARELLRRVLIIVPASLQLQWQSELKSKFNEDFEILDGAALQYLGRGKANPWMTRQNVICSLPFASSPKHAEQIIEAEWDLVIFDEAHRVRRSLQGAAKTKTTQAYRLADELKELVNGLLLLTATPMQVHPFELYSLIELVEPGLFPSPGRSLGRARRRARTLGAPSAWSGPDRARRRGPGSDRAVGPPPGDGRKRGERVAHIVQRLPAAGRLGDDPRALQPRDHHAGQRAGLLARDALALKLQGEGRGPRLQRAGRGRPQGGRDR
jgi:hypothetical protein